jgi:surface polysaccharide O-acyltransferase-like enzyme
MLTLVTTLKAPPRKTHRLHPSKATGKLASAPALGHLEGFDALRPMAAFSTVLVHCSISPESQRWVPLSRFSLPFFVLTAIYFLFRSAQKHPDVSFRDQLFHRASRLLLPFAAWNLIYAILRIAKHGLLTSGQAPPAWDNLWVGYAHHLWFLPFLLIVTMWVLAVIRAEQKLPVLRWPAAMALIALGVGMCFIPKPAACLLPTGNSYFLERTFVMLPSICWGTAVGLVFMKNFGRFEQHWKTGFVGLGLIVMGTIVVSAAVPGTGIYRMARHLSGMGVLLVALLPVRGELMQRLAMLGRCSYGIFLSHLVFVEGLQAIAGRLSIRASWPLDLSVFVISCVAATVLTLLLRRSPKTRWLAG